MKVVTSDSNLLQAFLMIYLKNKKEAKLKQFSREFKDLTNNDSPPSKAHRMSFNAWDCQRGNKFSSLSM